MRSLAPHPLRTARILNKIDPGLPTDPLDCLYFTVVTGTSVGYGDFAPATRAGKLAVCAFAALALQGLADAVDAAKDLWTSSAVCKAKED